MPTSVCYRQAADHCAEILGQVDSECEEVIFSGSSMGGWFARIMQLTLGRSRPGLRSAALAFNPAFDLGAHGHLLLGPQVNHVTGEAYTWTPEHGAGLSRLEREVDYDAPLPFYVYVDKGDEVIGWAQSAERHASIARFHAFEGGCHSFDHYREALQDFCSGFCE